MGRTAWYEYRAVRGEVRTVAGPGEGIAASGRMCTGGVVIRLVDETSSLDRCGVGLKQGVTRGSDGAPWLESLRGKTSK